MTNIPSVDLVIFATATFLSILGFPRAAGEEVPWQVSAKLRRHGGWLVPFQQLGPPPPQVWPDRAFPWHLPWPQVCGSMPQLNLVHISRPAQRLLQIWRTHHGKGKNYFHIYVTLAPTHGISTEYFHGFFSLPDKPLHFGLLLQGHGTFQKKLYIRTTSFSCTNRGHQSSNDQKPPLG